MSLPSNYCPHCHCAVQYGKEYDIRDLRYIYKAYCRCFYIDVPVTERQAQDKLFDESYAYELAWQRWKEEVDKKSMTTEKKNPDSEETGAIDADKIWGAVLDAMEEVYEMGKQHSAYISVRRDVQTTMRRRLKYHLDKLNDLSEGGDYW